MELFVPLFSLVVLALMGATLLALLALPSRLRALRDRLNHVEQELARLRDAIARMPAGEVGRAANAAPVPVAPPAPIAPPVPFTPPLPITPPQPAASPTSAALPNASPGLGAPPPALPPLPARAPEQPRSRALDAAGIEQLIGGVWLQNLGAVLLLLGVFLMIVWGYTTHRLGPQALVGAGVALGLAFVWRGDRVARRVAPFGHALIGTGIGIVYTTLYLGFVRLHVLPAPLAFALLLLVSYAAIAAGLSYRVQLIAALGVIGAFLPQFMAAWLGLGGFQLMPWALLAYLAVVNGLVFALAARAGWSALDLTSLILSALAWIAAFPDGQWGWGVQAALSALFTLLGLAPIPRLVRIEGRVRPIDLAVVAAAPLAMLVASAPFLSYASAPAVAMLMFALALVMILAVLWTDAHRPERDLWVPLTGATTLFMAAGLERALGPERTPVAWCLEGAVLIALGTRPGSGWLRFWGSLALLGGALWTLEQMAAGGWHAGQWPVLHPAGLRELACVVAVLGVAVVLARKRDQLALGEQRAPEVWGALGNLLLAFWCGVEAGHLASVLVEGAPLSHLMPPPVGISIGVRREALALSLSGAAWMAQAGALAWFGSGASRGFLRACSAVAGLVGLTVLWLRLGGDGWWLDQHPLFHLTAMLDLAAVAIAFLIGARLASRRANLTSFERYEPEVWAALASAALALWSAREAGHAAHSLLLRGARAGTVLAGGHGTRLGTLSAAITSGAWLAEATGLLVVGWLRSSAFLRWCGLALLGITVFKFIAVDLQTVDVFWRFLTAIVVGAAMLALSYAYQRRVRVRAARE